MADLAALNTVYNHYMTTYAPTGSNSKYDAHKKSELKGVVNSIVKLNKDSPLFLIDNSQATKEFAVNLKESARSLKNTISSLSVESGDEMLSKKTVMSSNDSLVSASYIGRSSPEEGSHEVELTIAQLARGQTNQGFPMPPDEMILPPDTYSFDIRSRDIDYEFQFNINEGDTNRQIEEKLARLITRSNIGIHAETVEDGAGNISLKMTSDDTGVRGDAGLQFIVSDDKTSKARGAVRYFGLDNITETPEDAEFTVNGESRSSHTNNVTVDKIYDLTLKGTTEADETVSIGVKTDVESLTDNISHLIMGYNAFMQSAAKYLDSQPQSRALVREMTGLSSGFGNELESLGLNFGEDGQISLDKNLIQQTANEDDSLTKFDNIRKFANNILDKANSVALDPLKYTDKRIVAYKNPNGHNYASPYITSNYSGMMFSSYC
ncbi:MAG: flagellar filament capping protein FliD [Lachnospiraceae bacterium]|nr:flagellar filament capping protein FliD [Lachnospiraceae bacterium]